MIADVVSATRKHAEKQQARTAEEKEAEIHEEEHGLLPDVVEEEEAKDDDEDGPIYNPLNLPLGWDGKPIPYWLYKLHGLGVEYKCEICGNQSYWGRRAFDRHFQVRCKIGLCVVCSDWALCERCKREA
jgi:splicing factor 3A subunit 3